MPRVLFGKRVSFCKGQRKPWEVIPVTSPPQGDQGNNVTGFSMDLASGAGKEGFFHSIIKTNITCRKSRVGQQGQIAKCLVETASQRTDNEDFAVSGL